MNDTMEKPVLALAVVEKKPQRPGGCVGIFFQLFDWNRRFAKKNIFSKKLLPPVRFKQASKKFGGDEKQPKLRLIADENNGGFPSAKNSNGAGLGDDQKHEMRAPGLVARLMGLESMPSLQRDKSKKKAPASGIVCGKAKKLVDKKEELNVERGGVKHEVRPQKLQKTSICEREPITRFGAEKIPFKNVLPRSRKHHPKLPSPVKSTKNLARKKPSKLIGAATRILEPGLQTSRSKCAITYSSTARLPPGDANVEERMHSYSRNLEDSYCFGSMAAEGESSCRNCSYLLDDLDGDRTISSQPLVFAPPFSNLARSSCQAAFYQLEEESHDDYPTIAGSDIGNAPCHDNLALYRSPCCIGQIQRHFAGQQSPRGMPLPLGTNQKPYRQNQMLRVRETVPPRPNASSFMNRKVSTTVAHQSLSCSSKLRMPARFDNGRIELEKRINSSGLVPPGRKRRPNYISGQGENSGCSITIIKPFNRSPHSASGKQLGRNAHYCHHEYDRVGFLRRQNITFDSAPGNNAVPFTFNSSVKRKVGSHECSEMQDRSGVCCDGGEELALRESGRKAKFEKPSPISGDALGALLEQKLKELKCQGEDTGNAPRKTTTTILQELITALTSDVPLQQDNLPAISDRRNGWSDQSHLSYSKGNAMVVETLFDGEHLSPGSVLEPFFSNMSCPSSSADDNLGYKMVDESLDCSYYDSESPKPNIAVENTKEMISDIIKNVSEILCCSGVAFGLKENELDQVEEVLLNAELAFQSTMLSGSTVGRGSPIKHLLLDELDMLASVLWMNFGSSLGIEDGKEVNQLKRFVRNSIMEYLGVRFQEYPENGCRVSRKLPLRMSNSMLILEIVEAVSRWEKMSRLSVDEVIEREMDHSLGEWTQFESEAFESGIEISRELFQILVDEFVMDLSKL